MKNGDLSMAQIAGSVNNSPTYFAGLFKQSIGRTGIIAKIVRI
jgi:AraC-like DNA-binding protein